MTNATLSPSTSIDRSRLYRWSRSRRVLWWFAATLLACGAFAGAIGSLLQPSGPWRLGERVVAMSGGSIEDVDEALERERPAETEEALRISSQATALLAAELQQEDVSLPLLLSTIPRLALVIRTPDLEKVRLLLEAELLASEAQLAFAYLAALVDRTGPGRGELEQMLTGGETARYVHYALGRVALAQRHYAAAFDHFHQEGRQPEAEESRYRALQALIKLKDYQRLEQLAAEPTYQPLFTPYIRLEIAIGARDWWQIAVRSPVLQMQMFTGPVAVMVLVCGVAWAFFFLHLAEAPRLFSSLTGLCIAGVILGAISTVPTVWSVIWQDHILGWQSGADPVRTIAYFVGGVGLREEACKLLLFLPLLPFVLRRDDEYEALMIASFVGLGFAIEENGSYFAMSQLSSASGRFLSANFFHALLTGLNGLALVRGLARGGSAWSEFFVIFPATVFMHGMYDAAMQLPTIDDTGTIAMAVYVLSAWYYFSRVAGLRRNLQTTVSLTGAYVAAISVVAAIMLAFQMLNLGIGAGLSLAAAEILGSAVLIYMFLREFREPLTA